jgi:lysophospholipase L1-like esterase
MPPKKTSLTIVLFGVIMLSLQLTRFAKPYAPVAVVDFRPRLRATLPPGLQVPRSKTNITPAKSALNAPNLIDEHDALKPFFQALWRTESKQPGAVTRILHYGDSPVTADSITADARSLMQETFGDAGHGFILIAKPWAWYGHRGVDVSGKGWHIDAASQSPVRDGFHGLGGVNFQGGMGASSHFVLKEDHARMEIQYLRQPGGGIIQIAAAGKAIDTIDTNGLAKQPAFQTVSLPEGARGIELSVVSGTVRVFGVSFERNGPGVIYNSLGLNGAAVQVVVRYFDKTQWADQLQHQKPDLVVVNYGTNESKYGDYIEKYYTGELRELIRRIKSAVPDASVLIMSPMDKGERNANHEIVTVASIPRLVAIQRQVAAETGCAFFNTFQAMGGEGTMARWWENQPRLVSADFTHTLPAGAKKVGVLLYQGLDDSYEQFKSKQRERLAQQAPAGPAEE